MSISSFLKQNKASRELEGKIDRSLKDTADLVKSILGDQFVSDDRERIEAVIEKFGGKKKEDKDPRKDKEIKFSYPKKTTREAEIDYHKRIQEEEIEFKTKHEKWHRDRTQTPTPTTGEQSSNPDEIQRITETRQTGTQPKPYYIPPTQTVVKIGDTSYELNVKKTYNIATQEMEWEHQGMDILERPETNDTNMEDNCITFEDKDRKRIDWETTINRLKEHGERLGYGRYHYQTCLQRILSQHDDNLFQTYKDENDPEKVATHLLAKYLAISKNMIYENKLRGLKREKDQPIRDIMCQADTITDRILSKVKDPTEKSYRKYTLMLEALKSFSSEENAKDLNQALRTASLRGERPEMPELIDSVEQAERVNENTKPKNTLYFSRQDTKDRCDIFTATIETQNVYNKPKQEHRDKSGDNSYNTGNRRTDSANRNQIERLAQQTSSLNLRGRESERKTQDNRREDSNSRRNEFQQQRQRSFSRDRTYTPRMTRRDNYNQTRNKDNYRNDRRTDESRIKSRENSNDRSYREQSRERNQENNRRDGTDRRDDRRNYRRDEEDRRGNIRNPMEYKDTRRDRYNQDKSDMVNYVRDRYNQDRNKRDGENYYNRDKSQNRENSFKRYTDRSQSRDRYRDNSRRRERDGSWNRRRNGQSRDRSQSSSRYGSRGTIPYNKRNLEGI